MHRLYPAISSIALLLMTVLATPGCIFSSNLGTNTSTRPEEDMAAPAPDMPSLDADMDEPDSGGCATLDANALCGGEVPLCGSLAYFDPCTETRSTLDCGECGAPDETCNATSNTCECVPVSDMEFCELFNASCGTLRAVDPCTGMGRLAECGTCAPGVPCQSDNTCKVCTPETREQLCMNTPDSCGPQQVEDDCGNMRTIECGACTNGPNQRCVNGMCTCEGEDDRALCLRNGKQCGSTDLMDRCGVIQSVNCGDCAGNEACNGDNTCPTQPVLSESELCNRDSIECGPHTTMNTPNNPSQIINCGMCRPDETCKPSGLCECPAPSCEEGSCGVVTNACGASIDCGMVNCKDDEICTTSNECECPAPICPADACGEITNDCGLTTNCGGCGENGQCDDATNLCECIPESDCELCIQIDDVSSCGPSKTNGYCEDELYTIVDRCGKPRNIKCCQSEGVFLVSDRCEAVYPASESCPVSAAMP